VKHVIFFLIGARASGPDGFGESFYHCFSDIIGVDVCKII